MSISDLANATLQRIDTPGAPTSGGDAGPVAQGSSISVRCILDEPTFVVRRLIDQSQLQANAVLYVDPQDFAEAFAELRTGVTVTVLQDGEAGAYVMRVEHAMPMSGGLPFVRCLVQRP